MAALDQITLRGFKSIRELEAFQLRDLNLLIGANGAGKSNLVAFFRLVNEIVEGRLQHYVLKQGGAETLLFNGGRITKHIWAELRFGIYGYRFVLEPDVRGGMVLGEEFSTSSDWSTNVHFSAGSLVPHGESAVLLDEAHLPLEAQKQVVRALKGYRVYHFHDTSETAGIKLPGQLNDNRFLRPDASNLAAFLRVLKVTQAARYARILETVQLAAPFFDDFILEPTAENPDLIRLEWRQKGLDYPFLAHHLSDGTLRFMALTVLLLQPAPPSMIILDEPELGLHPVAIELLASLLYEAARQGQVLASTQSPVLINHFDPEEVVVVDRVNGASRFSRLEKEPLREWLEDYSLGELVQKNVIEAGPRHE
ncbi:MAG: AAA family ATPase [Verrucomicrobiota bacterium]|jgi:predicted ATPase